MKKNKRDISFLEVLVVTKKMAHTPFKIPNTMAAKTANVIFSPSSKFQFRKDKNNKCQLLLLYST